MTNEVLNDLLTIKISIVPLNDFSPDSAITLWWEAKQRRPNQHKRKKYKKRSCTKDVITTETQTLTDTDTIDLVDTDCSDDG